MPLSGEPGIQCSSFKNAYAGARGETYQVNVPDAKPDDLSSHPRTHGRRSACIAVAHAPPTHIHTYRIHFFQKSIYCMVLFIYNVLKIKQNLKGQELDQLLYVASRTGGKSTLVKVC